MHEINIVGQIYLDTWQTLAIKRTLANANGEPVQVNILSEGGSVIQAVEIIALLAAYKGRTTAKIHGFAASSATLIAMACDVVQMSEFGFFMIHNADLAAWGDKKEHKEAANFLEKIDSQILAIYKKKLLANGKFTGSEKELEEYIAAKMDATTWLTTKEAFDIGFIDAIKEAPKDNEGANNYLSNLGAVRAQALAPKSTKKMSDKNILDQFKEVLASAGLIPKEKGKEKAAEDAKGTPDNSAAEEEKNKLAAEIASLNNKLAEYESLGDELKKAKEKIQELSNSLEESNKALDKSAPFLSEKAAEEKNKLDAYNYAGRQVTKEEAEALKNYLDNF